MKTILISQKIESNIHGDLIDSLEHNYIKYFENLGFNVILLPNSTLNLDFYNNQIEGIVLTGSGDINLENKNLRDELEIKLIQFAYDNEIPLLGICRGSQMINTYFNGSLAEIENHVRINHQLILSGQFQDIDEDVEVNSYHNYGIFEDILSQDLEFFAKTQDGSIEGFKHKTKNILGIMWHPERMDFDNKFNKELIFRLFI